LIFAFHIIDIKKLIFLCIIINTRRKIFIGLTDEQRKGVIELLNRDLSDTFLLLIKTKKANWDVWGPEFKMLQSLWDEQSNVLMRNIDSYAERTQVLGGYPVATVAGFLKMASIQENPAVESSTIQIVFSLLKDHEQIIHSLRDHIDICSEGFNDKGTADFLTVLMQHHEHMAWTLRSFMMRSFIEGEDFEMDDIFHHLIASSTSYTHYQINNVNG
jgi:starvation-inducible DNA-binding protein